MKKIILLVAALFCTFNSVYAMAPIDEANVKAAQALGAGNKGVTTDKLLAPWTIKDRKHTNKVGNNERAIVYTPYVTVAVNAQNEAKANTTPALATSMNLAKEYDGILSVGLFLNSTFKVEPKLLKIKLYQGDEVVDPYATTLEKATVSTVHMTKEQLEGKKTGISQVEKEKLAAVKKDVENRSKEAVKNNTPVKPNNAPVVSNVPTPAAANHNAPVAVKVWSMQYFTYFDLSKIDATRHVVLKVTDQGAGEREFVLDLPNLK